MTTPNKNKSTKKNTQNEQPITNDILPNEGTINRPKDNKLNASIGVSNLENPASIKTPTLSQEDKKESSRNWKPNSRVSAEELFASDNLPKETLSNPELLKQHAVNKLNSQFGDPTKDSAGEDWKYTDKKLESLRSDSYSAVDSVINNKKFNIPDHVKNMFTKLGKSNWVSTGSSRIAAHLRFNEQKDVKDIAQLLEYATGESFTAEGANTVTTEHVGKVLDKFLSTRNHDLYEFIKAVDSLPSKHHVAKSAIKASLAMMGMYEEGKHALSLGENISGKKWYKDMVEAHDKGLAHLISNHKEYSPISHIFGKVDNDGNWEKNNDQSHNMVIFKGYLAPSSNAMNPVDNGFVAFNMLRAGAIESQKIMRTNGINRQVEMFDIVNNMPNTQAGFGKEADLRDYVKGDISKNKSITYEDIAKKWHEKGYVNSQTNLSFTAEDINNAISNKTPLRAHTIENEEKVPIATKWMMNQGGLESASSFYKKFINGGFNKEFEQLGLHDFIVGNTVAENGAILDLTTQQGRQDAVNKLSTFLTSEFSHETLDKFKKGVSDFTAPDLNNSNDKSQSLGNLPGSWLIGPKIGLFFQNMNNNHKWVTADMWVMRSFGRLIGSLFDKGEILKAPSGLQNEVERGALQHAFEAVSLKLELHPSELQAVLWYHEQQLWKSLGNKAESNSYEDFINLLGDAHAEDGSYSPLYKTKKSNGATTDQRGQDARDVANLHGLQNTWGEGIPPFHDPQFQKQISASVEELKGDQYIGQEKHPKTYKMIQDRDAILQKLTLSKKGKPVKFAQFKPAPGGMTGAPVATRTNQPFSNAVAKSPGGKNLAQGALGNQINAKGGVETTAQNAVGDWPNGSEESIVHTAPQGTDPNRLKYLAAWHGIAGQKKSVLVFHPNPKGPDSLYHIDHPSTDMGEVRKQLLAAGIGYKTLLPGKKSTRVTVFDPLRTLRNTVDQFATKNNLNVEENIGQGEIVGHNGDWNSAGALPKSRQAYENIIGAYEQNSNQTGNANNTSGSPTNGTSPSAGKAQQLSRKTTTKAKIKFDRSRRILEGFLRQHNTPNKELPPVGDLLSQDLQQIKPEHLSKYQQLIPDAKWSDIEGAVNSLQQDPSLYDDMTSEANRREMYCKEHARTVLQSSGLKKLIDSLQVQKVIPEHAQHLIEDAKDGDYFSLEAISAELEHGVPSLRAFAKAAEKEYNKAGKVWDKMRTQPQPQKFAKKSAHAANQYRAGVHGVTFRGRNYNGGQFAPKDDGVKRFEKDSNLTHMIKKLRGA